MGAHVLPFETAYSHFHLSIVYVHGYLQANHAATFVP